VPVEYHKYGKVFSDEEAQRFPTSRPWDHAIDLIPEAPVTLNLLDTEDPLELRLKVIKANTEALNQSINCVILYASCLIVSMPYGLSLL
jgi:hypothetical protein